MKVLYVAHFYEGTGFSYAAINYVEALLAAKVDVVCRSIKLSPNMGKVPEHIAALMDQSTDGVTHVIQHLLPHHMSYLDGMKNIGLCVYDLDSLGYCSWDRYLGCMDEVWIPDGSQIKLFSSYGLLGEMPIKVVPHTFDSSVYEREYRPLDIPEIGGTCVFYTIGDLTLRKNLKDTVVAFQSAFHANEPVNLVIKTSKFGLSPDDCANAVRNDLNTIKSSLKLYPNIADYKPEILITHSLTQEQLFGIHQSGDCYINSSRGEAFSMPMFDAWAFGNSVIYYTDGDMYDYFKFADTSWSQTMPVYCEMEPCVGYLDTFPELGTARENWLQSNVAGLVRNMRHFYEEWLTDKKKKKHSDYLLFDYLAIGTTMKELLK